MAATVHYLRAVDEDSAALRDIPPGPAVLPSGRRVWSTGSVLIGLLYEPAARPPQQSHAERFGQAVALSRPTTTEDPRS